MDEVCGGYLWDCLCGLWPHTPWFWPSYSCNAVGHFRRQHGCRHSLCLCLTPPQWILCHDPWSPNISTMRNVPVLRLTEHDGNVGRLWHNMHRGGVIWTTCGRADWWRRTRLMCKSHDDDMMRITRITEVGARVSTDILAGSHHVLHP